MATRNARYSAEDIEILEDLSPILHRPGMYTDPINPNHALVEVIDNSSDEGLAGFAKNINVKLYEDGSAEVEDDGRGIPVDIHPEEEDSGGAGDLHHAAFGRQVPQDRQGRRVSHRRRPARRRHLRHQCARDAPRGRGQARRRAPSPGVRRQRQGEGAAEEDRHRRPAGVRHAASASGPTPSISIRRRSCRPTSPRCCAPRRCCCRA